MAELLAIRDLRAGYGAAVAISGISLALEQGEALALLGRNGTGKTTLIDSIVGVTTYHGGSVTLCGRDITHVAPEARAHLGLGWVPQERNIFRSLTVEENLTAVARPGPWTPDRIYEMFPRLRERRRNLGNQISGGEQQMLAVGRALMLNPKVLLLDEPLAGLNSVEAATLADTVVDLNRRGVTVVMIEHNLGEVMRVCQHLVVLDNGRKIADGPPAEVMADPTVRGAYLGVRHAEAVRGTREGDAAT
jgi:branched-chain amino acid transport system ATP-binding protein